MAAVGAEKAHAFISAAHPQLGSFAGLVPQVVQDGQASVLECRTDEPVPKPEGAALGTAQEAVVSELHREPVGRRQRKAGSPGQLTG